MPVEITMPQLSDTMSEGTVVKWHKKEGDKVRAGEEIADVETDKAVMPMEAFEAGTLAHVAAPEGTKVGVGQPIAYLATGKEDPAQIKKQYSGSAAPPASAGTSSKAQPESKSQGSPKPPAPSSRGSTATLERASNEEIHEPDEVGHHATRQRPTAVPPVPAHGGNGDNRRVVASPVARRIAADKGIDLSQIEGSGPSGRIVKDDVLAAAEGKPPLAASQGTGEQPQRVEARSLAPQPVPVLAARVEAGHTEIVPLSKIRSVIAQRLQYAKQTIPHFYETVDCDVEDLAKLRERLNKQLEPEQIRLSLGDLVAKAIATALMMHPALNSTFDGKDITRYGDVNLGMAVALPDGLIVPVLRGVNYMGFREIRLRSADLIERARAQRLKQDELSGATFTVSNLGSMGVREFSAIINPPEVGILAVGAAEKRAVVRNDQVVARLMMSVTLSADHRVVDGAVAAEFLRTLTQLLEEPGLMLV